MKRFRSVRLSLFLAVITLTLAACGGGSAPGTHDQPPIAVTQPADNVGTNSATLHGDVNPNGLATTYYFEYGTNPALNGAVRTPERSAGDGITSLPYSEPRSGLTTSTTYYFRIVAKSSAGSSPGSIKSCTTGTPAAPPTVQTQPATGVTQTQGTLNGQVNPNGLATNGRFRWGYNPSSLTNLTPWVALGSGNVSVPLNFTVTDQTPGTTICFRVEADSSAGNPLGTILNFITLSPSLPPTVTTLGTTGISQSGGTLNGLVNPNGQSANGRFRWGYNSGSLTNLTTWVALGSGTTAVPINFTITGQDPETTIYYRAEGSSIAGSILGAEANFTTSVASGLAPIITGLTVGTLSGDNVSVTLNVNPQDLSAVTDAWLETSPDNVVWTPTAHQTVNPGAPVSLTFTLTYLPVGDTYIRGQASNSWGADTWQEGDKVTVVANQSVTINVETYEGDAFIVFYNNVEVFRKDSGGSFTYSGVAGSYKFISIPGGIAIAAGRPYTVVDETNDHNVFQLTSGDVLELAGPHLERPGRVTFFINGSGYTSSYQAPVNVSGLWHIRSVVDNSTNGNAPVGTVGTWDINVTQNENQILWADPDLGLINGTINGDLVYNWGWGFSDPLWLITWRETLVVNTAGTILTGDNMETWQARSGTDFFYTHGNSTGTR